MASFNFKLVFLFIIVSFVHFATTKAGDFDSWGWGSNCYGPTTNITNSPLQMNLRTLINYLSSNASNKEFYNTTVHGKHHSSTVYGMFMCRGDLPSEICGHCVSNATEYNCVDSDGSFSTEAYIMNDKCMVRYSNNQSFTSTIDLSSQPDANCDSTNVSASFMSILLDTMTKTADEAASSPIHAKKYATKQARISIYQKTLYTLAQCTPDLSPQDCRSCLNLLIEFQRSGSSISEQGRCDKIQNPSCLIQTDFYPFYRPSKNPAPTGLIPATPSPKTDSRYSQDAGGYLSHNCSSNRTTAANRAFLSNLRILFSSLSSNATSKTGFYQATVDDTVYGLFMCRGDVSPGLCQLCVQKATERISSECGLSKEAIIWYNHCLLRYSSRPFLSTGDDTTPAFHEFNMANTSSNLNQLQQSFFTWTLANTLSDAKTATGKGTTKNYGTVTAKLNHNQTLYALAQCTPDLDDGDCSTCLQNIFIEGIPWCCLASPEGKVLYPSCYMMFGLSKFYGDGDEADAVSHANPPQGTSGEVPNINHFL